jgi:hypothetical protein
MFQSTGKLWLTSTCRCPEPMNKLLTSRLMSKDPSYFQQAASVSLTCPCGLDLYAYVSQPRKERLPGLQLRGPALPCLPRPARDSRASSAMACLLSVRLRAPFDWLRASHLASHRIAHTIYTVGS